jgi:anti-sigma factor RsiW
MTSEEAHKLLHAYLDGELDAASAVELESAMTAAPALAQELARLSALQSALKSHATRFQAPPGFNDRLLSKVAPAADDAAGPRLYSWWRNLATGAAGALLVLLVWSFGSNLITRERNSLLEGVVTAHIRSLMADHLTDLASTDRHTVKPWLSARLDFAPPVHDSSSKLALVGGRLDYVDNKMAAAVVYRYRQHIVNAFVWPAPQRSDSSVRIVTHRGYNAASFDYDGMSHWVVSDLNRAELAQVAASLQHPPSR